MNCVDPSFIGFFIGIALGIWWGTGFCGSEERDE